MLEAANLEVLAVTGAQAPDFAPGVILKRLGTRHDEWLMPEQMDASGEILFSGVGRGQGVEAHRHGKTVWTADAMGVLRVIANRLPVPSFRKTWISSIGGVQRLGPKLYLCVAAMDGRDVLFDDRVGLFLVRDGHLNLIMQNAKRAPAGSSSKNLIKSIEGIMTYQGGAVVYTETIDAGQIGGAVWRLTGQDWSILTHDTATVTGLSKFPSFSKCDIQSTNSKGDIVLRVLGRESAESNQLPVGVVTSSVKGVLNTIAATGDNAEIPDDQDAVFDGNLNQYDAGINDAGNVAFSGSAADKAGIRKHTSESLQFLGAIESPIDVFID